MAVDVDRLAVDSLGLGFLVLHVKSVGLVAERLGMSERTLRRKLEQEGTSFRELIDELRAHAAIKYVRDTDLTIEDVAYALGFIDAAAFRRAFRRWTKSAPHEYRRGRIDIEPASRS